MWRDVVGISGEELVGKNQLEANKAIRGFRRKEVESPTVGKGKSPPLTVDLTGNEAVPPLLKQVKLAALGDGAGTAIPVGADLRRAKFDSGEGNCVLHGGLRLGGKRRFVAGDGSTMIHRHQMSTNISSLPEKTFSL
jgi:hypothetical protein